MSHINSELLLIYLRDHRIPLVLITIVGIIAIYFARQAVVAWEDAVKLDVEERGIAQIVFEPMVARMAPQNEIQERALRLLLMRAGLRDDASMRRFSVMRVTCLGAAVGASMFFNLGTDSVPQALVIALFCMFLGFRAPDIWLNSQIAERQARIARALPNVVDLMVLCLDVGLSVEAAFERVTIEMRSMEPLMAEEAQLMVSEVAAGFTFPQALRRMAERIGLEELVTLSRLIYQAAQLGASIATAMREYSEASFQKRLMTLEENAGKISSMMVMPITMCMLPAAMIALIGPAIISLAKNFVTMWKKPRCFASRFLSWPLALLPV